MPSTRSPLRIGGASGFWGDSSMGAPQLVAHGDIDVLVFDYLAELTMSILAAQKLKNPEAGYATDFVSVVMRQVLGDCLAKRIKVVSNAGGMNPHACATALKQLAISQGLAPRIAVISGDDVSDQVERLRAADVRDLQSGRPLPARIISANAYLGALPIQAALDAGADIVITGRCVDSAVTIGAALHRFGWQATDYDRLALTALAGHIIECGAQATGGLFTDWRRVPDWAGIGYPIIEFEDDTSFVVTKPPGTGGLVVRAAVIEQILYEIGDPGAYILPDVVCDFRHVSVTPAGPDKVRVTGARGQPPTPTYKVSATAAAGFRSVAQLTLIGFDAAAKAQRTGEALLERTRRMFAAEGLDDYAATRIDCIGAEAAYGPHAQTGTAREVIMRLAVRHRDKRALEIFAKEFAAPGTSFAPGTTGGGGGRPDVSPSIEQCAFLIDKSVVTPRVELDGVPVPVHVPVTGQPAPATTPDEPSVWSPSPDDDLMTVPLIRIAHGRSGDKGDISNIGLVARSPAALPVIEAQVTAPKVKSWLAHLIQGDVRRYALPGLDAFNFVCEQALGGGGMASLRHDPLGKAMAQLLLSIPVRVPRRLVMELDAST